MDSMTEDLWTIILARLPLKTIATSKLVCKQWKSILESEFLRELFMSHHRNSQPSWSLMSREQSSHEVVAHYGCETWGLTRSLGSYVTSFIAAKFQTKKRKLRVCPQGQYVRVLAYSETGLILIYVKIFPRSRAYYVANPVSRQCVKIPPPPLDLVAYEAKLVYTRARLVTRTENGAVSGYKVVLLTETSYLTTGGFVKFIIYSSETGLWSANTSPSPLPLIDLDLRDHVTLNGSLHWLGLNLDRQEVVVSFDFYGSDHQWRVIPFPDSGKNPNFRRSCTSSQGDLMYMNILSEIRDDGNVEHKLSVWRLKNVEYWQLVCEISPDFIKTGFDYLPLAINPFDGHTYLWCERNYSLTSINLCNGGSRVHNVWELSRNGQTLTYDRRQMDTMELLLGGCIFSTFVLPRWLHPIPQAAATL